ncbi:uncharacterized protein MKZ38_004882 [Zalerion maritima]|uniref:HMG box domain-containing protein n=1 Tax=Zalerion maritima TaxID=339359 RepID=A0AAD5RW87_9PEZI|nr:uncharacterized protein MKZ38_004882 [Zalerion maritima]
MPKRKAPTNPSPPTTSQGAPPVLPPTVEEAYRRKCMELKQRSKEVEDVNDATKLRISRLKRQVDKLRVERSFLLEQLSKRTSTNVEDSEGSPSPPPTPKEKPLRIKRGHRKPSILQNFEANPVAGSTFINQNLATLSPSSDAFSHPVEHKDGHHKDLPSLRTNTGPTTNGASSAMAPQSPKKPQTAFEMYADTMRDELKSKQDKQEQQDDDDSPAASINVEEELATAWKNLTDDEKEVFHEREQVELEKHKKEKDEYEAEKEKEAEKEEEREAEKDKEEAAKKDTGDRQEEVSKEVEAGTEAESNSKSAAADKDVKTEPDADEDTGANPKTPVSSDPSKRAPQDEDVEMANEDTDQEQ